METAWLKELWEAAKLAGPFGTLLMTFIAYLVNREREKLISEKDSNLKVFRELTNAQKEEGDEFRERLISALNQATIAISTNASNLDSVKSTLAMLAAIVSNRGDRR